MSLATRIESLVIRVAQEFNDVRTKAGNLANLTPHPINVLLSHSHPPVLARIRALRPGAREPAGAVP